MTKKDRPMDINQLAKFIVELSTGEITEKSIYRQSSLPSQKRRIKSSFK
jgi:hypothetical protein